MPSNRNSLTQDEIEAVLQATRYQRSRVSTIERTRTGSVGTYHGIPVEISAQGANPVSLSPPPLPAVPVVRQFHRFDQPIHHEEDGKLLALVRSDGSAEVPDGLTRCDLLLLIKQMADDLADMIAREKQLQRMSELPSLAEVAAYPSTPPTTPPPMFYQTVQVAPPPGSAYWTISTDVSNT